jgi:hypothetical protein
MSRTIDAKLVWNADEKRWEYEIDGVTQLVMGDDLEQAEVTEDRRRRGRPTKAEAEAKAKADAARAERERQMIEDEIQRRVDARVAEHLLQHKIEEDLGSEQMKSIMSIFMAGTQVQIDAAIKSATGQAITDLEQYLDGLKQEIIAKQPLMVLRDQDDPVPFTEKAHRAFPDMMRALSTGFPVMLVGPAGSGKTYAAAQAARAMDLDFYAISVGSQTSKIDLLGYLNAAGDYVSTQFRQCYEHGGVFLMDEIDAGNPNVLIVLNSALSSHACAFPDGMVPKHHRFIFIGTANTYGMGANRQYVGRNQIDAATLDRFITVDWPVDEAMERGLVEHLEHGLRWHDAVCAMRTHAAENEMRIVISPRATLKGALMLEAGEAFDRVLSMCVLSTASPDQIGSLTEKAASIWRK